MDLEFSEHCLFRSRRCEPEPLQTIALRRVSQLAIYSAFDVPEDDLDKCEQLVQIIHRGIPPLLANDVTNTLVTEVVPVLQEDDYSEAVRKRLLEASVHPCTSCLFIEMWHWDAIVVEHFLTSVLPSLKHLKKLSIQVKDGKFVRDLIHKICLPENLEQAEFGPGYNDSLLVATAKFCPRLRSLKLDKMPQISIDGIKAIIELQHLEVLDIGGSTMPFNLLSSVSPMLKVFRCDRIEAKRLNVLAETTRFTKLSQIEVRQLICDAPLDDGHRALTVLHVGYTLFTPRILSNVGQRLQELRFDTIDGLDLWTVSEQCPVLKYLHVVFCKHSNPHTHSADNLPSFPMLKHVLLDSNWNMCEWCTLSRSSALEKVTVVILQYPQKASITCLDKLLCSNSLPSLQEFGLHGRHHVLTWETSSQISTALADRLIKSCPRLAVVRGIQCPESIKDLEKLRPGIKIHKACDLRFRGND